MAAVKRVEIRWNPVAVGARLRALREARGFSRADVEARTGIKGPTLAGYEYGQRTPHCSVFVTLAALYRRSLDFILCGLPRNHKAFDAMSVTDRRDCPSVTPLREAGDLRAPASAFSCEDKVDEHVHG